MSRRVKVAFLSFDFGEYCVRVASALTRHAEVLLLLAEQEAAPYKSLVDPALKLQTFGKPRLRQPLQQIRMIRRIVDHIWHFDPHLIHMQAGHLWFNFALPLLGRYPLVLTNHDPRQHLGDHGGRKTPQWILNYGCRRANQLIVHAPQLKQVMVQQLRVPSERVHVVPIVLHGDDAAQSQVHEDGHRILFFGRIWEYKGLEYLIRAEPLISSQVPDVKIVIAGKGEDFARYRRMMVHPERFIVHNEYVSNDKRAELFRQASVVVLPYVEASQSGVIPVAYRSAKAVVATTVGGLPDLVDHGRTGFLVPPRDEKALADAIVRLLGDAELRHRLGANGKQKIETENYPPVIAQKTFSIYELALNKAHPTS